MDKIQTFKEFIATQNIQVSLTGFIINLVLTAVLAECLGMIYRKFGKGLSNKNIFSNNFIFVSMTTMLIITVVKSSLSLSLGLVGALSIVRFRTAIKDPEELAYLFLTISIGLGLGANQRIITLIGFGLISVALILKNLKLLTKNEQNLYFVLSNEKDQINIEEVSKILSDHCQTVALKRFDESDTFNEAVFFVKFNDFNKLTSCKKTLRENVPGVKLSLSDINAMA